VDYILCGLHTTWTTIRKNLNCNLEIKQSILTTHTMNGGALYAGRQNIRYKGLGARAHTGDSGTQWPSAGAVRSEVMGGSAEAV
jgi:hypothetical protein